jgi:hypothetical protein
MNRPTAIVCAGAMALLMNLPLSATAAVPGPRSDESLRWARSRVEFDIDMLQRDQHDYDGHRVKAVEALQDGRTQLDLALAYDAGRESIGPLSPTDVAGLSGFNSDANLAYVRHDIERVIDALQRDDTDYGGHRTDAIARLQDGRQQIVDALRSDGRL